MPAGATCAGFGTEQAALAVGVSSRTLRNWKAAAAFQRELERQHKRAARQQTSAPSHNAKAPARRDPADTRRARPPAPATEQETTADAGERPSSGFRRVDGVPLWGDSDG